MVAACASIGGTENPVAKASMWWIVLTYLFNTIGELCLSPIGLSMVSKLAPIKYASLLMGMWLAASGVANLLAGAVASTMEAFGPMEIFATIAGVCIGLGVILLIFSKKITKLME